MRKGEHKEEVSFLLLLQVADVVSFEVEKFKKNCDWKLLEHMLHSCLAL